MQRLINLLDLIEQKKDLIGSACLLTMFLAWDGEKYGLFIHPNYQRPVYFTIEEIKQQAFAHEPWRTKQIADYQAWLEKYPEDADDLDGPLDETSIFEAEWEEDQE